MLKIMLLVTAELGFEPTIAKTMFFLAAPHVLLRELMKPVVEFFLSNGIKDYARP